MPASQGRTPKVYLPGATCGKNANGDTTNNSYMYRGRPYCKENLIEQTAMDVQKEQIKPAWQRGLRIVGLYLTTGKITTIN